MGEGGGGGGREIQFYNTTGTEKYSFAVPFSILTLVKTRENRGKPCIKNPILLKIPYIKNLAVGCSILFLRKKVPGCLPVTSKQAWEACRKTSAEHRLNSDGALRTPGGPQKG